MEKIIVILGIINKYVCALALGSMVLLVFFNTMLRYFKMPNILIAEEVVRYLFIWSTFLGVIAVYYQDNHIRVTVLTDHISKKAQVVLRLITNVLAIVGLLILLWGSVEYFLENTSKGQVTGLPYKVAVLPVIFASFCCILIIIKDTLIHCMNNFIKRAEA